MTYRKINCLDVAPARRLPMACRPSGFPFRAARGFSTARPGRALAHCLTVVTMLLAAILRPEFAPSAIAQTTAPCNVRQVRLLGDGGNQDWSFPRDLIAYDRKDATNTHQLHTIRPDGSGDMCLSCTASTGAPRVDRHKVNPVWHPGGQWIVVQGENEWHPLVGGGGMRG